MGTQGEVISGVQKDVVVRLYFTMMFFLCCNELLCSRCV